MRTGKPKQHLRLHSKTKHYACRKNTGKDGISEKDFIDLDERDRCVNCNYKLAFRLRKRNGKDLNPNPDGLGVWPAEFFTRGTIKNDNV